MTLKTFDTKVEIENYLAKEIEELIRENLELYGEVNILLSGGQTPLKLYEKLGSLPMDWSKINIGLVDERYVPQNSEFNNQHNIERALNLSSKEKINVIPMVVDANDPIKNIEKVNELYSPFYKRIDFCLLGMGNDGHTASLFPDDKQSNAMLIQNQKDIKPSIAPTFPQARISCNKALILSAKIKILMLIGPDKLKVLEDAITNNLPISEFTNPSDGLKVYYAAS